MVFFPCHQTTTTAQILPIKPSKTLKPVSGV